MWYSTREDTLTLQLEVKPGRRNDSIEGLFADRLKVKIKAPPVAGSANNYLIKFFAREFKVTKSNVEITRGRHSRTKTLVIHHPASYPDWFNSLL